MDIAEVKKRFAELDYDDEDYDYYYSLLQKEQEASIVVPTCCESAKIYKPITYYVDIYGEEEGHDNGRHWSLSLGKKINSLSREELNNIPNPKFCPYCGTKLPNMIKKEIVPPDLCRVTDGGYYCDNCSDRLSNCLCLCPSFAFEPEKTQ